MASFTPIMSKKRKSTLAIRETILNSPYIQIKFKNQNITKIDIKKDFAYLAICIDDFSEQSKCSPKECRSKMNGFWNDFEIIDNQIIKTTRPCSCLQAKKGNWSSIENISLDFFDLKFQNTSLKDLITSTPTRKTIKKYLQKFIESFPKYNKPLILMGPSKSGKTFISSIIANELFAKDKNIALINLKNSLDEFYPENEVYFKVMKQRYINTAALFIINLGSEKNHGFSRDFFLFEVIKKRAQKKKPTFITTSSSFKQLSKKYSKNNKIIEGKMFIQLIKDNTIPIILERHQNKY